MTSDETLSRLAQLQLHMEGYYAGKIDGIWGPMTQAAYEEFKRVNTGVKQDKENDSKVAPRVERIPCPHKGTYHTPHTIILHHCGGTWEGTKAWLMRPVGCANPVSYHYHISQDGFIREYVSPKEVAWHARNHNTGYVGIAFTGDTVSGAYRASPTLTDHEIASCVSLIRYLQREFPRIKTITTHRAVDPKRKNDISPAAEAQIRARLSS